MAQVGRGAAPSRSVPYERIKRAILTGEFAPGSPLVETTLARWCDVSRTPVREALTRLEQDGLVERGDRGLVVRDRSPEEILDIYETRIALESTAARVAAERRTSFDLIRLQRLLDRTAQMPSEDQRAVDVNREFHRQIWEASHNDSLFDLLERLNLHLMRYPATTLSYPDRWETAAEEHRRIVEAIADRDAERAAEAAARHFIAARDIRLTLWEQDLT